MLQSYNFLWNVNKVIERRLLEGRTPYSYMEVPGSYLDSEAGRQGRGFPQSCLINSGIFPSASLHILLSSLVIIVRRHTFHRN